MEPVKTESKPAHIDDFGVLYSALFTHFTYRSDTTDVAQLLSEDHWGRVTDLGMRPGDRVTCFAKHEPWNAPWIELVVSGLVGQKRIPTVKLLRIDTPRTKP